MDHPQMVQKTSFLRGHQLGKTRAGKTTDIPVLSLHDVSNLQY